MNSKSPPSLLPAEVIRRHNLLMRRRQWEIPEAPPSEPNKREQLAGGVPVTPPRSVKIEEPERPRSRKVMTGVMQDYDDGKVVVEIAEESLATKVGNSKQAVFVTGKMSLLRIEDDVFGVARGDGG